jgi:integrase
MSEFVYGIDPALSRVAIGFAEIGAEHVEVTSLTTASEAVEGERTRAARSTGSDLGDTTAGRLPASRGMGRAAVGPLPQLGPRLRDGRHPGSALAVNPTAGLEMRAVRGRRDRIASPDECAKLLEALPVGDRALWATAMYGGLRRGQLMALRIEDVELGAGVIRVSRGWDYKEGEIPTKSGRERKVPIAVVLRDHLDEHLLGLAWREGLVFGASASSPFTGTPLTQRADRERGRRPSSSGSRCTSAATHSRR